MTSVEKQIVLELQSLASLCMKDAQAITENGGFAATYEMRRQLERIESLNDDAEARAERNAQILGVKA